MYETMHNASGIGLAAPQIGKSIRLFVVDGTIIDDEPGMADFKKVFLNPVILEETGMPWDYEEGCLEHSEYPRKNFPKRNTENSLLRRKMEFVGRQI